MRVITLQEPWASLIAENIKVIETRSWPCYEYGELYIHAGKSLIPKNDSKKNTLAGLLQEPLYYGTIFAKCTLSDCIEITEEYAKKVQEKNSTCYRCGDFTTGRYAWILENIEPIEKNGKLGIWYYEESN